MDKHQQLAEIQTQMDRLNQEQIRLVAEIVADGEDWLLTQGGPVLLGESK